MSNKKRFEDWLHIKHPQLYGQHKHLEIEEMTEVMAEVEQEVLETMQEIMQVYFDDVLNGTPCPNFIAYYNGDEDYDDALDERNRKTFSKDL